MCFKTTPNVWAQVSRTGATTYRTERKKTTYFVELEIWLGKVSFQWILTSSETKSPNLSNAKTQRSLITKSSNHSWCCWIIYENIIIFW
jgi:hypothetical protein